MSEKITHSRRRFLQATGALGAAAVAGGSEGVSAQEMQTYGDGSRPAPPETDVEAILAEMSVDEKIGQMIQANVSTVDANEIASLFTDYHVGSLLTGSAYPPSRDPVELAKGVNALQEYAIGEGNGVPFVYGLDTVHGNVTVEGATAFPHNVGMGATRDPELMAAAARHTGDSASAIGAHWGFAPTSGIARDPRWGRFYETLSEDPHLTGELGAAAVRGLQEGDAEHGGVAASVKHFAAYSEPQNGDDRSPARIPVRDLVENHLVPHHMGLQEEPLTVMINSGSVNGVPAHASSWLLTDVLRDRMGFEGLAVSDWNDFHRMVEMHEYAPDLRAAVKAGVNAGVDMAMLSDLSHVDEFHAALRDLVEAGEVPESRIDEAARRSLELKAELGLLDDPYVDPTRAPDVVGGAKDAAREAVRESLTLLKNEGDALPLAPTQNVVLAGPNVDDVRAQCGGWTIGWQGLHADDAKPWATTIADGVRSRAIGGVAVHETGYAFNRWSDDEWSLDAETKAAIVADAKTADRVVLVLGEGPYAEGFGNTDELALPAAQRELVDAVADLDTEVVGLLVAGRPRGTSETLAKLDAFVMAYYPGSAGGAVADVLYGDADPGGRLAFRWPDGVGQVPNYYNQYHPAKDNADALFDFGAGQSYTEFAFSDLTVSPSTVADAARTGTATASVTVTNTGDRTGTALAEAFYTEAYGSVQYPRRKRLGSEKVELAPGRSRRVTVEFPLAALAVVPGEVPGDADPVVEAGDFTVELGGETATLTVGETVPLDPTPGASE
ncbi:glycoside hydrolase family 3 N-terminal domain-containing protein [Halarchaeum nitratireducens]|uniref:beta-glucosidase n=1 Tax=Halarchaeum nitratireducens TaxID=489913 RepID=A0A830GCX8_9EURY|nr:glycoside hydrolase family 3 N-terminal domain-containing protein [Halarchaeum nitratireducens]GGN22672.1 glycosyl hydrolase [Halarchaeum nitratireducens]